jgi:hypothetical protein
MLRRRIQFGLHIGQMRPGDRLPSLRAAASEFGVDQRSVLTAYRELEAEGIVEMRPRSGIYIAASEQAAPQVEASARWLSEVFLQGFDNGVPPVSLGALLTDAVRSATLIAVCVECNADQMLWLASQLRDEFGIDSIWIEDSALETSETAERLASAHLIVTTTFHAPQTRRLGKQHGLPVVIATGGRGVSSIADDLPHGAAVLDYAFSNETRAELIAVMLSAFLKAQAAKTPPAVPAAP